MPSHVLPYQDDLGFTNILMSALGGDGANLAAKLLFKIAVEKLDLDGGYDAKYGSEKTGTTTNVSIRLAPYGTPVRESGPTRRPHMLSVFRELLIRTQDLVRGLQADATVMVTFGAFPLDGGPPPRRPPPRPPAAVPPETHRFCSVFGSGTLVAMPCRSPVTE